MAISGGGTSSDRGGQVETWAGAGPEAERPQTISARAGGGYTTHPNIADRASALLARAEKHKEEKAAGEAKAAEQAKSKGKQT